MTGRCGVAAAAYWIAVAIIGAMIVYATRNVDTWFYLFIIILMGIGLGVTGAEIPIASITQAAEARADERLEEIKRQLDEIKKTLDEIKKTLEE